MDKQELCPFRMNISLCKNTNVWFLHCGKGNKKHEADLHKHHLPMQTEHIHSHLSLLPQSEAELLQQCSKQQRCSRQTQKPG